MISEGRSSRRYAIDVMVMQHEEDCGGGFADKRQTRKRKDILVDRYLVINFILWPYNLCSFILANKI